MRGGFDEIQVPQIRRSSQSKSENGSGAKIELEDLKRIRVGQVQEPPELKPIQDLKNLLSETL